MDDDDHTHQKINRANVRLLRESIKDPIDALEPKKRKDLKSLTPNFDSPPTWWFVTENERQPPPWIGFTDGHVKEDIEFSGGLSQSCLLFLKIDNRFFVLTFGASARHFLKSDALVPGFGYEVTNKVLDPASINNVESCYLEANSMRSKKQIPNGTFIGRFGLDSTRDNVRALAGKAKDEKFGKRLHGAQGLVASQAMTMMDLVKMCRKWLQAFNDKSGAHQEIWSNFVEPIDDPALIGKLNEQLIRKIQLGHTADIIVGIPDFFDVESIEGFRFSPAADDDFGFDLNFQTYLRYRSAQLCTVDLLKRDMVQAKSAEDGRISSRWSFWDCLEAELRQGSDTFLLHSGQWHQVPSTITQRLNQEVDNLQNAALSLPVAWEKEKEGDYNKRVSEAGKFMLMDRKIIRGPGYETGIELCDLASLDDGMFIHVKRGTDSASLSHLLRQGITAARAFNIEQDLQRQVKALLKATNNELSVERFMSRRDHTVVFGIMTPKDGKWSDILPFFSKLSLSDAVRELRAMRYDVKLLRIEQKSGAVQRIKIRRHAEAEV